MIDTTYSKTVASATNFFDYAERHGLALFPCAAGTKRPILPWKEGSTADRKQWVRWVAEGHNLAIDCAKSGLIVLDIDCSKVTREEAWNAYRKLCISWDLASPPAAMAQSARLGWHVPFKRPGHLAATDLRGGGTLVKISDVRPLDGTLVKISDIRTLADGELDGEVIGFKNRGYCVAPGSQFEGRPYLLMPDAPAPHECPAGLVELIRLPVVEATFTNEAGKSDVADVARLVAELDMFGEFSVEPDWYKYMGAIKLALGDTEQGVEVALQMTRDDATDEAFYSRWKRLASVDDGGRKCRIGSMIHRYKELTGKAFHVGKSAAVMFQDVAAQVAKIAADAGAQLPPLPYGITAPAKGTSGGMPLPEHPSLTAPQAASLVKFWAHLPSGKIIHEPSRGLWASGSFDKHIGRIKDAMKTEGPGMLASTWASQNRPVHSMGWDPGEPMIIEARILTDNGWIHAPGCRSFNTYLPPDIEHIEGDVSNWVNHIRFIYPNEAHHIVHWFAHRVQRPGDKINHGLVFIGDPGIGKDTAIEPVVAAIGPHNFKSITAASFFKSDYNGYLKSVMLRIDEVHDLGGESKYAFHDRTKTILAAPPMAHQINEKFVPHHSAVNVCGTILTSNHPDALYLPRDDRRHFVCVSTRTKENFPDGYFDNLYARFENGGNEAIAHFLANLDLSAFNAKAPPPKTAGWHMIVAAGMAPESGDLADVIESLGNPPALTLSMIKTMAPFGSQLRASLDDVKLRKAIPKRLGEAGYIAVPNPDAASDGRWRVPKENEWRIPEGKTMIYARRELSEDKRLTAARRLILPSMPG